MVRTVKTDRKMTIVDIVRVQTQKLFNFYSELFFKYSCEPQEKKYDGIPPF